jgi:hypothetical protein
MEVHEHNVPVIHINDSQRIEILQCLLHSILFMRAPCADRWKLVEMSCVNHEYHKIKSTWLSKLIRDKLSPLQKIHKDEYKLKITFFSEDKGSLFSRRQMNAWENWNIHIKVSTKVNRSDLLREIQHAIGIISQTAVEQSHQPPPIEQANFQKIGIYPFMIQGEESKGFMGWLFNKS